MNVRLVAVVVIALSCLCLSGSNGQEFNTLQVKEKLASQWQIPLSKCCADPEFYVVAFDDCKEEEGFSPSSWPPPVYSVRTNESVTDNPVTPLRFALTYNMPVCGPGFDSQTSSDFRLYTDGSVAVTDGGSVQRRFEAGEFCLNEILGNDVSNFAVHFCVADPCNETNCVRKCCPMGMAMNETTRFCQTYNEPFVVAFQDTEGNPVTPDAGSYLIRDGDTPVCSDGMYTISPQDNPDDQFYILTNGQMYVPSALTEAEKSTGDYCIDDFLRPDSPPARVALTCFPVLEESLDNQLVFKVFPYLLLVSSIFLIATFVVYAIIPEIRNIHGVTIMCHVASLAVMYIGLGIIQLDTNMPTGICVGLAVVVHFAFLSTFTWLNVMSFDIWWTFSPLNTSTEAKAVAVNFWMHTLAMISTSSAAINIRHHPQMSRNPIVRQVSTTTTASNADDEAQYHSELEDTGLILSSSCDLRPRNSRHGRQHLGRRIIFYSIYAWGVPFIIVLVGQILDHVENLPSHIITPGFGELKCWFANYSSYMAYLYGPIAVLILSNIVFFVMTAVLLYRASIDAAFAVNSAHAKQKFRVIFSLFILMGVSWMMEVISFAVGGSSYIWIPTDILNILTGVFIFVIFVCKPNVWKLLKLKCPCLESLDRCCPSFMTRSNTRQGTTTRSTLAVSKSLNPQLSSGNNQQTDDLASKKKKLQQQQSRMSLTMATQSTQLRDSTQVDSSGDD